MRDFLEQLEREAVHKEQFGKLTPAQKKLWYSLRGKFRRGTITLDEANKIFKEAKK